MWLVLVHREILLAAHVALDFCSESSCCMAIRMLVSPIRVFLRPLCVVERRCILRYLKGHVFALRSTPDDSRDKGGKSSFVGMIMRFVGDG